MKWFILYLLALSSLSYALVTGEINVGRDVSISYNGVCHDFDIYISSSVKGCWDVKLDVDGKIYNNSTWTSTFFYVKNALCKNASLKLKIYSNENEVKCVAKLRQNSTIIEKPFIIHQDCPKGFENKDIIIAVLIVCIFLFSVLFLYKNLFKY